MLAVLKTKRLLLRPAQSADAPAMHAILSDPGAMRYWSTEPHAELARTEEWIAATIEARDQGTSIDDLLIELDGRVIGKAGFWRPPELGFILHPSAQGHGYASEALRCLLERAFELHRLPRVVADVDPRNEPCLRLLERLGFGETGRAARTYCVGGIWSDSVYLALEARAWRAGKAARGERPGS
jgi:RimJ/RimL family protein N-acetyltransferase